jgi:D-alanyl-D-alanine carboxypeptidase (penicillin-binding protein 5/6)
MLDYGFANYALVTPELQGEQKVPVILGKESEVTATPAESTSLLVDKAQVNQVNIKTELESSVTAPVSKGQRLGTLTVKVGEQVLKQVPILARDAVAKQTFGEIFRLILKKLVMAGT